MSSWFRAVLEEESNCTINLSQHKSHYHQKHRIKHGLNKKNTQFKFQYSKCRQALKRKLRKYKLRKDGSEDQDVIDVSEVFHKRLTIFSSQKENRCQLLDTDLDYELPKNYLFKMARKKQKAKDTKIDTSHKIPVDTDTNSQEQNQTNAFKMMMESRNKSIGSNSPGKEKEEDSPTGIQETSEKKIIKAKRNLVLQKMAEAKGALKNKEIEECKEKIIKKKMDKRADKMKEMLTNNKGKTSKNQKTKNSRKETAEGTIELNKKEMTNGNIGKKLVFCDIFNGVLKSPKNISTEKKKLTKEDEEFLKKLSPSLKKKENMLCYFKKIEKQADISNTINGNTSPVLKVKSASKKKKIKKLKLSLKKDDCTEVTTIQSEPVKKECALNGLDSKEIQNGNLECRKRKRKATPVTDCQKNHIKENVKQEAPTPETGRPKRIVKKPVKYSDDLLLDTSDDELLVFTPKKRRHVEKKRKLTPTEPNAIEVSDEEPNRNNTKKPTKLAPIFVTKPQLNQDQLEARQKFLYSGVPEQLKKIQAQQKPTDPDTINNFPVVVHVQQKSDTNMSLAKLSVTLSEDPLEEDIIDVDLKSFQYPITAEDVKHSNCIEINKKSVSTVLQSIKEYYPKFPVYRTYRHLKGASKGEIKEEYSDLENSREAIKGLSDTLTEDPENLNWIDKYKPKSSKNLIGNFETVRELKKWLETWTENDAKPKTHDSDSSDFYYSDTDSKDSMKTANNLLILTGPVGSGKTTTVYAVAAELAMKVIEVNASSKRTGKMMLQDLQEATQSHKVNRAGADNSQKSQEIKESFILKTYKRKGRPKKLVEKTKPKKEKLSQGSGIQEEGRTEMSLILIDDADIVFEQDDGFTSAIGQLVQSSKRPVILVTTSLTCPHLQRFVQCGKVMKMRRFSPKILGTWLDLLCLADNGTCWPGLGAKFLDYFKGDLRKSINNLQFYVYSQLSGNDVGSNHNSEIQSSIEDENSNLSWGDSENIYIKSLTPRTTKGSENVVWDNFLLQQQSKSLHPAYPQKLIDVWWSLTEIQNFSNLTTGTADSSRKKQNQFELEAIAKVIDALSVSDFFSQLQPDTNCNITSLPWYSGEIDSVSENENWNNYNQTNETQNEIRNYMVSGSISNAQNVFGIEQDIDIRFPDAAERRHKQQIVTRHDDITNITTPSATLDRRALALDYWPSCRTICRIEKSKTDIVSKRHNRFSHYFKTMSSSCRNEALDCLADSLSAGKNK